MTKLALICAFGLAACVVPTPPVAPLAQRIIPTSNGLNIIDSNGQEISFGRAQLGVEVAINRLVGAVPTNGGISTEGCDLRQWKNGLELVFHHGRFVGWIAGPPVWGSAASTAGNTCGFAAHKAG